MKNNLDIRRRAEENAVLLWQIAEELGISDSSFSRQLRKELPQETKDSIFSIIDKIAKERKEG